MNFILFSDVNDSSINQSLGRPEYSYYFVLKAYRPVLESLGRVHVVHTTAEVDPLYRRLLLEGQESLFVSFNPPQKTPTDLSCPTICVVAWEFDSIPDEHWDNDPHQDWSRILARHGRVITLSNHTAQAVRRAMGEDFPVLVLPTPLWENFASIREQYLRKPVNPGAILDIKGCILDTRLLGLTADALGVSIPPELTAEELERIEALRPPPLTLRRRYIIAKHHLILWSRETLRGQAHPETTGPSQHLKQWYWESVRDLFSDRQHSRLARHLPNLAGPLYVPPQEPPVLDLPDTSQRVETQVDGVVYVSVFNPDDGRKNWHHLITAFCWAFREVDDATLVLKITHNDLSVYYVEMLNLLAQLSPFACRVVVMHGYLDDLQYSRLYGAANFYVNASRCEGLCLPLMEFMASGKPAIAPNHTAMQDYIDETVAFVVKSSEELTIWPHDPRIIYRTLRHRPDWGSLKTAYQDSYRMAKEQPDAYRAMSQAAIERMRDYCAFTPIQKRLSAFFGLPRTRAVEAATLVTVADNA
jgi:glycosyltransferase involved in cell wall biosynthesis